MGGGGKGLIGTVLSVASVFVPVLQPVAIAYNSIKAVETGNPLNIALAGFGAYNAFSGAGGFGGDSGGLDNLSNASYMGDMGGGGYGGLGSIGDQLSSNVYMGDMGGGGTESLVPSNIPIPTDTPQVPQFDPSTSIGLDGTTQLPVWANQNNFTSSPNFGSDSLVGNTVTGLNKSLGDIGSSSNFNDFANNTGLKGSSSLNLNGIQNDVFNPASPTTDTASLGSTINPTAAPDNYGETQYPGKTNSLEGMNSGNQQVTANSSVEGMKPPSYTYENSDFLSGRNGTGMNANVSELAPNFKQGPQMNNLPDIWNKLTTPVGSQQGVQATPLGLGARGLSALYDIRQQGKAQKIYQDQLAQQGQWADQNSARNQVANTEWTKTQTDPMYGYSDFLRGAGGDFLAQARAKAAATGNRGSYLNSGRMQTDLANLWLKNQAQRAQSLAGGFSQSNPYQGSNQLTAGYADMVKGKSSPLGQFANYAGNFDLSKLWS